MTHIEHDTTELRLIPLSPEHAQTLADLGAYIGSARRHIGEWDRHRDDAPADAETHLKKAVGVLERLVSTADELRADLTEVMWDLGADKADKLEAALNAIAADAGGGKR